MDSYVNNHRTELFIDGWLIKNLINIDWKFIDRLFPFQKEFLFYLISEIPKQETLEIAIDYQKEKSKLTDEAIKETMNYYIKFLKEEVGLIKQSEIDEALKDKIELKRANAIKKLQEKYGIRENG